MDRVDWPKKRWDEFQWIFQIVIQVDSSGYSRLSFQHYCRIFSSMLASGTCTFVPSPCISRDCAGAEHSAAIEVQEAQYSLLAALLEPMFFV